MEIESYGVYIPDAKLRNELNEKYGDESYKNSIINCMFNVRDIYFCPPLKCTWTVALEKDMIALYD